MDAEVLDGLTLKFLGYTRFPAQPAPEPYLISVFGLQGSGKSTASRMLTSLIRGGIHVQANSARFVLKRHGMGWGPHVHELLKAVDVELLNRGYGVIQDGSGADTEDRANLQATAKQADARLFVIRMVIYPSVAERRERAKYNNPNWISTFDDFRVAQDDPPDTPTPLTAADKMAKNLWDRWRNVHQDLRSSDIPHLVAEIDNNGSLDDLNAQIASAAALIRSQL